MLFYSYFCCIIKRCIFYFIQGMRKYVFLVVAALMAALSASAQRLQVVDKEGRGVALASVLHDNGILIGTTDINGVASIKININKVGTFTAQAMYAGNSAYNAVTRDIKIRIV